MEEYRLITSNIALDFVLITAGMPMLFFVIACIVGGTIDTIDCMRKAHKENVSFNEAKKLKKEEKKEQSDWDEKVRKMKQACREIAEIYELKMHFQNIHDYIVGNMTICYKIDEIPLFLKAFKCSMSRRYFDERSEEEIQTVIFFAYEMQDVIDYLNCYNILYEDTSGFYVPGKEYTYDGTYIPLQVCNKLEDDISYAQAAFVINTCTGKKWMRENNRARYHSVA